MHGPEIVWNSLSVAACWWMPQKFFQLLISWIVKQSSCERVGEATKFTETGYVGRDADEVPQLRSEKFIVSKSWLGRAVPGHFRTLWPDLHCSPKGLSSLFQGFWAIVTRLTYGECCR